MKNVSSVNGLNDYMSKLESGGIRVDLIGIYELDTLIFYVENTRVLIKFESLILMKFVKS